MTPETHREERSTERSAVSLTRHKGARDQLRSYQILIDGDPVMDIGESQTKTLEVNAGIHRIRLKIDWVGSPEILVDAKPGETVALQCRSSAFGMGSLLVHRNSYLELRPADELLPPQRPLARELALRLSIVGISLIIMLVIFLPVALTFKVRPSVAAAAVAAVVVAIAIVAILVRLPVRKQS